jgi:hypothetical protein
MLAYYAPLIAALDSGEPEPDSAESSNELVRFPGAGLRVGLMHSIAEVIRFRRSSGEGLALADSARSRRASRGRVRGRIPGRDQLGIVTDSS